MMRQALLSLAVCLTAASPGAAAPAAEKEPDLTRANVVIVLDASLSMREPMRGKSPEDTGAPKTGRAVLGILGRRVTSRMDAAKHALRKVLIGKVPENVHVGILVFSSSNLETDWVYPLGPADDARFEAAVALPLPGGLTPLGAYIKKGADALLQQREKQRGYGTYRLLIVTDGEATDPKLVERYIPDVLSRGIVVNVIGVSMDTTHTLATKVHSYHPADDPASLEKVLGQVIRGEFDPKLPDAASKDVYETIGSLPRETAAAVVKAMSETPFRNHPIGEKPKPGAGKAP